MKQTLFIQNLKCGGCANTIISKLSELDTISETEVDVKNSSISFSYMNDDALLDVKNKLSQLGYPVEGDINSTFSKAKSFVSCAVGRISN